MQDDPQNSRPFSGFRWSDYEEVDGFIESILEEMVMWAKESLGRERMSKIPWRQHLKFYTLEAFENYLIHPLLYTAVARTPRDYPKESRYHNPHLTYDHSILVQDFLAAHNYFDKVDGYKDKDTGIGRKTRVRATKRLIGAMLGYGIEKQMIGDYPYRPREIIILRSEKDKDKKAKDVEYRDDENEISLPARENLQKINQFLLNTSLNLHITDDQESELAQEMHNREEDDKYRYLDFSRKSLHRVFNNGSFEQGGRFYGGWWQDIPSGYRYLITINGNKTIELDYSGMHFAIMYAKANEPIPGGDPYLLPHFDHKHRSDIKKAFNIIINCENSNKAIGKLELEIQGGRLSEELHSGEILLNAFKEFHDPISNYIASGYGVYAQYLDSKIAERVMLHGIKDNLCILPVHDSFIIRTGEERALRQYMNEAFQHFHNRTPDLGYSKLKRLDLVATESIHESTAVYEDGSSADNVSIDHLLEKVPVGHGEVLGVEDIEDQVFKMTQYDCREAEWLKYHSN